MQLPLFSKFKQAMNQDEDLKVEVRRGKEKKVKFKQA